MRCPSCGWEMVCREENQSNRKCSNRDGCPQWTEKTLYSSNVSVKDGWWFASSYCLSFKYGDCWYAVVGPRHTVSWPQTVLYRLTTAHRMYEPLIEYEPYDPPLIDRWRPEVPDLGVANNIGLRVRMPSFEVRRECVLTAVNSIEYFALPVAEPDFTNQFRVLVDKLLSAEKPLNYCLQCGEPHDPNDECEEEALMRGASE